MELLQILLSKTRETDLPYQADCEMHVTSLCMLYGSELRENTTTKNEMVDQSQNQERSDSMQVVKGHVKELFLLSLQNFNPKTFKGGWAKDLLSGLVMGRSTSKTSRQTLIRPVHSERIPRESK